MRVRTATVALLVSLVCTAVAWLSVQPTLLRLVDRALRGAGEGPERQAIRHLQSALPLYMLVGWLAGALVTFAILRLTVTSPLREAERAIEELGRGAAQEQLPLPRSGGAALVSQIRRALERLADALNEEKRTTRRQLEALRQANAEISRTQTELLAAERLATVGRLAAGIAHEVRNPLSGILGYLSLARARTKDPQVTEFLQLSEEEVRRIDGIVRGLLDLGRPQQGELRTLALGEVVHACVRLVRKDPTLDAVEVREEISADVLVRAESGPLSQIVINLLLNAGQAMDGKGQVLIRATPIEGAKVALEFEDSGPGLSPEASERLFEPFFTTRPGRGTGLGLAVSQHLAASLGATLIGANRPQGGARFTLLLQQA